jgi:hypothetical protein
MAKTNLFEADDGCLSDTLDFIDKELPSFINISTEADEEPEED